MTVAREESPARPATVELDAAARRNSRARLVVGLSVAAIAFAVVGAVGPATKHQARYSWPPSELPEAQPRSEWYTPLLLTKHVPGALDATIPCRGATPLADALRPLVVLATTRLEATGGLKVTRSGRILSFSVGSSEFASVELAPADPDGSCTVSLRVDGDRWALDAPGITHEGALEAGRPFVTGLFTGVDLRRGSGPSVAITTEPFRAKPIVRQVLAWILASLCALSALVLVVLVMRPVRSARVPLLPGIATLTRALRPVDGFVALLLATWWIVGPVLFDDGWVKARQTSYDTAHGFSNYYTTLGANLPLDFWLEWLQHWIVGSFDAAVVLRLPTLALLAAAWIVCRWALAQIVGLRGRGVAGAEWALGIAFVLNALAWSVTLRPEPAVGLLVIGVLGCAIGFSKHQRAGPLAIAVVLAALALSAHPAGLISLAPLLAISPQILAWAKAGGRKLVLAPILLSGLALLIVLGTVGSDLAQRMEEARLARTVGDATAGWRAEITRYEFAGAEATTLRRESVALMLVAVLAYLLRGERMRRVPFDLPAASLGIALLLLIATPSKWAWHFGALAALSALAVAAEVARLQASAPARSIVRPIAAILAITLVIGWAWFPRVNWSSGLDLRTYDWTLTIEDRISLTRIASALPIVAVVTTVLLTLILRGRDTAWRTLWRFVPWLVPIAVLPLLAFNLAVLVRDAVETPAWSFTRQNMSSLVGDAGCGMAEDTRIALPGSMRPLAAVETGAQASSVDSWTASPPLPTLEVFSTLRDSDASVETPPYTVPAAGARVGFFVSSVAATVPATLSARWGVRDRSAISWGEWAQATASSPVNTRVDTLPWSFIPEGRLPPRPEGATAIQLSVRSEEAPPRVLAATGAVSYQSSALETLMTGSEAHPLVAPNLLLYLPCTKLPRLENGIVESPTLIVSHRDLWTIEYASSPFLGVLDLYALQDLSVGDSRVPPSGVHVLWVDNDLSGAVAAPPDRELIVA